MNKTHFTDWGLIDYQIAWDKQEAILKEKIDLKLSQRKLSAENQTPIENHLIFCEHPHVYTLGKSGDIKNLLLDDVSLQKINAKFNTTNRGGDITYHGPGQIVGYPILDLEQFFKDIHKYMRFLEESIIKTLRHFDIKAERNKGLTGVWLDANTSEARKICAMGVRCSRWITMHGFALNVNTDLSYFDNIIPCGIHDKKVTSIEKEMDKKMDIEEVKLILKKELCEVFEMELI